ncbi:MAG: metalloregulator ArsR/SmtB family transcription factor [Anaerolineae bacterium]
MPKLVEGASPLEIRYAVSLPHSLLATVSLLCATPQFEGLGEWLREVRASLPADLLNELCLMITFPGGYQRFTTELLSCLPANPFDLSYEQLVAHLQDIPNVHYQAIALRALARGATPAPEPSELLDIMERPGEWAAYLAAADSPVDPQVVAALVRDGNTLQDRLLASLDRFWHMRYAVEYKATKPLMEHSVRYHQSQHYTPTFQDTFVSVTGRLVPEQIANQVPHVRTATFVPNCYVGPYVAYVQHGDQLIIFYNCRTTPAGPALTDSAWLYPPLKALADETRLQILALLRGHELYAQEIVQQMHISQPAVSRHLNLMAAAGVLKIRREGNAKYYTVDEETLAKVASALRSMA